MKSYSVPPHGIDYWIIKKKPTLQERLRIATARRASAVRKIIGTITKRTTMKTKRELKKEITSLKCQVKCLKEQNFRTSESYNEINKKYETLQKDICELFDKADLCIEEKRVVVPNSLNW